MRRWLSEMLRVEPPTEIERVGQTLAVTAITSMAGYQAAKFANGLPMDGSMVPVAICCAVAVFASGESGRR